MVTFHFSFCSFHLDRNDKGQESEEEIWADDENSQKMSTKSACEVDERRHQKNPTDYHLSKSNGDNNSPAKRIETVAASGRDTDDYGGSTDVDEPDTDDEIERSVCNHTLMLFLFYVVYFFSLQFRAKEAMEKEVKCSEVSPNSPTELPNFFRNCTFNIHGTMDDEVKRQITRYVIAFGG